MGMHKKTGKFFGFIVFTILVGIFWIRIIAPSFAVNPQDDTQSSQVRIAWDEFKKLLKIDADEIKLSWDEFKKLLAQTGSEVKIEYNIQNKHKHPREVLVTPNEG